LRETVNWDNTKIDHKEIVWRAWTVFIYLRIRTSWNGHETSGAMKGGIFLE
jgi:hypothetical protein